VIGSNFIGDIQDIQLAADTVHCKGFNPLGDQFIADHRVDIKDKRNGTDVGLAVTGINSEVVLADYIGKNFNLAIAGKYHCHPVENLQIELPVTFCKVVDLARGGIVANGQLARDDVLPLLSQSDNRPGNLRWVRGVGFNKR
jgi:hypothetical protein